MASVKVIYYTHKQYTDGSHPIMLQIIDGKSVVRKTLHRCNQWDEKTKRVNKKMNNYSMINAMISDKLAEAEKALLVGDNPFLAISSLTLREVVDMEVTR
jgi:hypothetical protein